MTINGRASQAASVEVLTAEVRVLHVGAHQVTLSVYRQLDWVPADEIEPFGRVQHEPGIGTIQVVGSHRGQLARSKTTRNCGWGEWCPERRGEVTSAAALVSPAPPWVPRVSKPWGPFVPDYSQHPEHSERSQELWEAWEALPLIMLPGSGAS